MEEFSRGVRIGVDVGAVRVGVALSDPNASIATPWETLPRDPRGGSDIMSVAKLADSVDATVCCVGLPLNLKGLDTKSTTAAREWATRLKKLRPEMRVFMVDERLTSVSAHRALRDSGVSTRDHRSRVDQQAAVYILQAALEAEKLTGRPSAVEVGARKPRARKTQQNDEGGSHDA